MIDRWHKFCKISIVFVKRTFWSLICRCVLYVRLDVYLHSVHWAGVLLNTQSILIFEPTMKGAIVVGPSVVIYFPCMVFSEGIIVLYMIIFYSV